MDGAIENGLRRVCVFLAIDTAFLWQWSVPAPDVLTPTHSYPAQESPRPRDPIRQEQYPWVVRQMRAGRMVVVPTLEGLPAEAAVDVKSARLLGIKSSLCLPLLVGGESPVGALAFNTMQEQRDWPDAVVKRLQLVAQVFANALARKREHEALAVSEARLASGAELASLAFYEVDFGKGTVYFDDRFRDLCGVPPDREPGLQPVEFWIEHLRADDRPRVLELRRQLHAGERDRFSCEYRYVHPARGEMWVQHLAGAAVRDVSERAIRTYGVLRDVTDRRRAEEELRDLSRRLIRAHEEERALLARELHDDLSQRLAILAIDVGRLELAAGDEAQAQAMRAVREGLVGLSDDIHSLAYQLHPSVLEELGLVEALRAEGERCAHRGLHVWAHLDPLPDVVSKEVALCLFRVAQEALSNVLHHAAAKVATVRLRQMDGGLFLAVSDNGVGFVRDHPKGGMNLGLLSMRERVRLVNGTLDIESAPGDGTTIVAWVPTEVEAA